MIVYADLHVHIGQAKNRWVKITASRELTIKNALSVAKKQKGLTVLGLVDSGSKVVLAEYKELLETGQLQEVSGGGFLSTEGLLLIPAWELEIGEAHYLAYLPNLESLQALTKELWPRTKNQELSTQRFNITPQEVRILVESVGGIFFPAHVFTPFKGFYGKAVDSLYELFLTPFLAIELGLSSSTEMAAGIAELEKSVFLSNSDAHSLKRIAREYNEIDLPSLDFAGFKQALSEGSIIANYGLDPRLGKYYETACINCGALFTGNERCECGGYFVNGVRPRCEKLGGFQPAKSRPPYFKQIPLDMLPGIGPATIAKLITLGPELHVLNKATFLEIAEVTSEKIAKVILEAREGNLAIEVGGAGYYGKAKLED